jgi:hypothetical protein
MHAPDALVVIAGRTHPIGDIARTSDFSGDHRRKGILIAAGNGIIEGGRLAPWPRLVDVAPTVLALFGLPPADDMEGRPIADMLGDDVLAALDGKQVASYDHLRPQHDGSHSTVDREIENRLKALGYL